MRGALGREVVIVEAVRTPIGRGHPDKGYFKDVHPADLLGRCYAELIRRSGVPAAEVEYVIAGCVQQFGEQSMNIARNAWLQEGFPIEASASTIDLQCGSSQQAIGVAASLIASGIHEVAVASGVEHMGHNSFGAGEAVMREHGSPFTQRFRDRHDVRGQGIGAELIADRWAISRQELDELALRSHQKAARATEAGWFHRELVELHADGAPVRRDQGIRADTSIEALAGLKPAFKPDGRITAGNSSQISDGAAAVLLMARDRAESLGLRPRARIVSHTSVGCDPVTMLEGPIPATRRILAQTGTALRDIDVVEINEAFASVVAAWQRELDPDMDRVNPRGGAIALGHPLGSTGARLVTTLLHELEDEDGELGLVTMCCGGGLGTATLIQRV
jgi:acetyl-CoA acetyltransferase family protein